jgi:hypothetical protein
MPITTSKEDARLNLRAVIQHFFIAANMAKMQAKAGAKVCLAVIAKNPDGSGQVGATFEAREFLANLVTLVDDPDLKNLTLMSDEDGIGEDA